MNYDFLVKEEPETGAIGAKALFMEGAEPRSGFVCAHDIMEHFQREPLNTDSELLALGAMFYIRGEGGYFNRKPLINNSPGYQVSGDLSFLYENSSIWGEVSDPGITKPVKPHIEEWIDESFSEFSSEHRPRSVWFSRVRGWLRRGYLRALKRYGNMSPFYLSETFCQLEKSIEEALSDAELGDMIRIQYVRKTGSVRSDLLRIWDKEHINYEPWED